jgi:hypothetical protein
MGWLLYILLSACRIGRYPMLQGLPINATADLGPTACAAMQSEVVRPRTVPGSRSRRRGIPPVIWRGSADMLSSIISRAAHD